MLTDWQFVHVPKTGGTSIMSVMGGRADHVQASKCRGFLFAFVRNPYDRFWSAFEFLRDPRWGMKMIPESTRFDEFVLSRAWPAVNSTLFYPMKHWLDCAIGFVGRFERLQFDFDRVCEIIGIARIELPRKHARNGAPWQSAYTPETRSVIAHEYADDFLRFGYGA